MNRSTVDYECLLVDRNSFTGISYLSEEDKDMIENEISLVIQNIIENSLKD